MVAMDGEYKINATVTIIVPIYNAEKYLDPCIGSILAQTYHELELLLINDGSSDASEQICQKWAQDDQRVRYIYQKNCGVSAARNNGLNHAHGSYIVFVDADDYICDVFVQQMLGILKKNNADLVYCGTKDFWENGSYMISDNNDSKIYIWEKSEYEYCQYKGHYTVWGALFKKEIIDGLLFQEDISVGEDSVFFAQAVCKAKRIIYYDSALYNYRNLLISLYHGKFDEKKYTELEAWRRICDIFEEYPLTKLSAHVHLFGVINRMLRLYIDDPKFQKIAFEDVRVLYRANIWFAVKYDVLKRKNPMKHILKGCFPNIYVAYLKCKKYWKK